MPRGGPFERALDACRKGRFRAAEALFLDAKAELRRIGRRDPKAPCLPNGDGGCREPTRPLVRALVRKTNWALAQARILTSAVSGGSGASIVERRLSVAFALHDLYLEWRALHGRDDSFQRERAERAYRAALAVLGSALDNDWAARARLGLAGVLADAGTSEGRTAAKAEFARVPAARKTSEVADLVAHYFAAMGDTERAFEALEAARDALAEWTDMASILRVAPDLDALRDDPRFDRLLGSDK